LEDRVINQNFDVLGEHFPGHRIFIFESISINNNDLFLGPGAFRSSSLGVVNIKLKLGLVWQFLG